jgi:23S rRNA (cytidine2498-2'-O)-methyltransferase
MSCALAGRDAILGLNRRDAALCDWPGGKVRLGRTAAQVSRAEFKLEELFDIFDLQVRSGDRALDLGAAPGGWTRILRTHDLIVWAVDPGDLDPSLADDRSIHHSRTTAGEFLRTTRVRFDMVVNDMRMEPKLSCRMMIDAAARLNPGGLGVVTLKTGSRHVLETVRACLTLLSGTFEIVHARQLHHNRHEVTVVVRKRR